MTSQNLLFGFTEDFSHWKRCVMLFEDVLVAFKAPSNLVRAYMYRCSSIIKNCKNYIRETSWKI